MMDTDTACARQQVMLRAKYRGDTTFERKDRAGRRQRQNSRRRGLVSSCLLDALTILSWNIDV